MKKSILITLLVSTALLVGCSKNEETKTSSSESSSSLASSTSSESSSSETSESSKTETNATTFDFEAIKALDFSSIYGTWKNGAGETMTFSSSTPFTLNPFSPEEGIPSLHMEGVVVELHPIGDKIGKNEANYEDKSDQTKDRIVITNGGITSEQTTTEVFYRQ